MSTIGDTAREKWVSIPAADHTDVDKLITVVSTTFDLNGIPMAIRRVKILASEGTSLEISLSMKSILPLCKVLLEIVQADILNGGELVNHRG